MDLISIRRTYNNRRNLIFIVCILLICVTLIITTIEVVNNRRAKKLYLSYLEQVQNAENEAKEQERIAEEQKAKEEEERRKKSPQLTEEGKTNMANIYKSDTKRVFLTFDDGPSSNVTPMVLDTLKAENIKATFFLLGSRVELNPEIVKREFDEGHYLASHGYSHVYSQIYASPQSVLDEYNNCITAIRNAIGMPDYNPHLFRFPGGYWGGKYASIKTETLTLLDENNIAHIDWNALTSDAAGAKTTEEFIAELQERHQDAEKQYQKIKTSNLIQIGKKLNTLFDKGLGICIAKDLYLDRPASKVSKYLLNFLKDYVVAAKALIELKNYME